MTRTPPTWSMPPFPRSRMLFLVRDGRDVLDSLLDANRPTGLADEGGGGVPGSSTTCGERRAWIREHCRNWVARMNVCLRRVRSARRRSAPARVLRGRARRHHRVSDGSQLAWLELPATSEEIRRIAAAHSFAALPDYAKGPGMFRRSANPGSWREGLADEEQQLVQEIMGELLVEFGYA